MHRLLIVEDSAVVQKVLRHLMSNYISAEVDYVTTMAEARELLTANQYTLALVDLALPDAPDGEVVELTLQHQVPTVVLTASINEFKRQNLLEMGIIDYVLKENRDSYYYAVRLISQLLANRGKKVLVADDSSLSRTMMKRMLERLLFCVIESDNGADALKILQKDPTITLLLTDYAMPQMDGIDLVKALRNTRGRDDLAVIGISGADKTGLSAKFIKHGANDFLTKPFVNEEFHCRVLHTVEQLSLIQEIKESANRDHLTNLYNRRYLYGYVAKLKKYNEVNPILAMFDIDFFKRINDTYGHQAGDEVLRKLARKMKKAFGDQVCVRLGGEEFAVIFASTPYDEALTMLESFRRDLAKKPMAILNQDIPVTISIGVAEQESLSLDDVMKLADDALYRAKESGRNCLMTH